MIDNLLLIPTIEPLNVVENCISSFYSSIIQNSTLLVVIYNGADSNVLSDFSCRNVVKIGFEDSKRLVYKLSEIANSPEELLFGKQEYGRSYGGASNLLLALGHALGASVIGKIDDDCRQLELGINSWLHKVTKLVQANKVCFGSYVGKPSGFLYKLPKETAIEFIRYVYSKKIPLDQNNLGTGEGGKSIKNGNIVIPKNIPRISSYPVLYEPRTKTHARGEVYYWMNELKQHNVTFSYEKSLQILHEPSNRNNINKWLRSLVLAFDLSLVHRRYIKEGKKPKLPERRKAISQFKSWILRAKWPKNVLPMELGILLDNAALEFTEKFYSELCERKKAWRHLMSTNLGAVVQEVLPELNVRLVEVATRSKKD